ncbi:MAG: hypothetical protein JSV95_06565 [Gemmatimonadota bacterium]|jgi:hypothetical protein|nr:MAG: hypothetical protein JSV95_06565 [Gemmatimonadota bacterium]
MRLEIRLALIAIATGVAAAVLVGRRPPEQPLDDREPAPGAHAAPAAAQSEADSWFI